MARSSGAGRGALRRGSSQGRPLSTRDIARASKLASPFAPSPPPCRRAFGRRRRCKEWCASRVSGGFRNESSGGAVRRRWGNVRSCSASFAVRRRAASRRASRGSIRCEAALAQGSTQTNLRHREAIRRPLRLRITLRRRPRSCQRRDARGYATATLHPRRSGDCSQVGRIGPANASKQRIQRRERIYQIRLHEHAANT